jgi:hypothetical protein
MLIISQYQLNEIDRQLLFACCRQLHQQHPGVALRDLERIALEGLSYGCESIADMEEFLLLHIRHESLMAAERPDWFLNLFVNCTGSFNRKLIISKNNLNPHYGK